MAKDKEKKKKDKKVEVKERKPRKLKKKDKKKALKKEEKKAKKKKKEKKAGKKEKSSGKKKKGGKKKKDKGGKKKKKESDGLADEESASGDDSDGSASALPADDGAVVAGLVMEETIEMAEEGPEVFLPFHPEEDPAASVGEPSAPDLQNLAEEVIGNELEEGEKKRPPIVASDNFGIPPIPPMEDPAENREVGEGDEEE